MKHIYSTEEDKFLIDNVKGITLKELTNKFNRRFNYTLSESAIANRKYKLKITSGITGGQFHKGFKPHNKGKKWGEYMSEESQKNSLKTTFKKGNVPFNHREVGSERINKDGYIEIKVSEPNKWQLKHRYLYEKEYGKIPDGHNLIFLDGNKQNLKLSNLKLISKAEDLIMNNNKLFTDDKNLTETGTLIAKVINKYSKLKKGDK